MEKLIKEGNLKRYIRELDHQVESGQATNRITANATVPLESKPAINYILGGPSNDQYSSKHQQKKLLRASTVKAKVNSIHAKGRHEETKPIDGFISFPFINLNMIIVPYYDTLVLTLSINYFDENRVLVDPASEAILLQLPAFKKMKLSLVMVNSVRRILYGFNGATIVTLGDVALLVKVGLVTIDRTKTRMQFYDVITKGLLSNPRQRTIELVG